MAMERQLSSPSAAGVGLLGAGVVGSQVVRVLVQSDTDFGHLLALNGILVQDKTRQRDGVPSDLLTTDPEQVLSDDRNDIIVEVMGGEEPAHTYMAAALKAGKHVVTANKEVLAKYGDELTNLAAENGVSLSYEASVGGGIPVLAVIQDSLRANRIESIRAIINGTTNFVLSSMEESGSSFEDALAEAQSLGYAEADPTADVDAHDAVYKLSILTRLAFGASVNPDAIHREGIRNIGAKDLRYAGALGVYDQAASHCSFRVARSAVSRTSRVGAGRSAHGQR